MAATQLGVGGYYDNSQLMTQQIDQAGPILKIYVTLRKDYESDIDYKRLTLMIESTFYI